MVNQLDLPRDMHLTEYNHLYISDWNNHRIVEVTPGGEWAGDIQNILSQDSLYVAGSHTVYTYRLTRE